MTVHCGPGYQTGFDIDASDIVELEQYHDIIVASAIFGTYDVIQQPTKISEAASRDIPFYMFIDEQTEAYMRNASALDYRMKLRSIALMQLVHAHTCYLSVDQFIKRITACVDVPEGCVIIREHIPITNLFTCLWFNEVDRFTSRDQLSFATVRDKIMAQVDWSINMFMDCERRNFVIQEYLRRIPSSPFPGLPLSVRVNSPVRYSAKKNPVRRKGERRPRSRRHPKNPSGFRTTIWKLYMLRAKMGNQALFASASAAALKDSANIFSLFCVCLSTATIYKPTKYRLLADEVDGSRN
ncbi:inner membrane protein OxaA [Tanacetum coccineum]